MISLRHPEPVQAVVICRGERHRLEYRDGGLHALDHDDVDGELTLRALGGEAAECAELVEAWRRSCTDLRVLVLASRGAADQLADAPPPESATATQYVGRPVPAAAYPPGVVLSAAYASTIRVSGTVYQRGGETRVDPLVRLFALNRAIAHRLATSVIGVWTERLEGGETAADAAALRVALTGRAQAALAEWASRPADDVEVVMLPPGSTPTVHTGDRLEIGLPFSWLADVWAPGLSQLLGRFTLAATESADAIHLDTLDASLERSPLVVTSR
jgi:hypothetical protein